jgi:flavin reductase (DIM6/NTAB) family NADH-FMN oxidoreductase RutF
MDPTAQQDTHAIISPAILYWGTPVILISPENEDGTTNIAPMSSSWWLGHSCMLGLDAESKTTQNMLRTRQCVLNLPDETMVAAINGLADTTGSDPVSESKKLRNYKFVKNKWAKADLHPQACDFVAPQRIRQCKVQMECEVIEAHSLRSDLPDRKGLVLAVEVRVLRVHIAEDLRMVGSPNRIDPDKWRPVIMMFQEFYGLRPGKLAGSVLGRISEEKYRGLTKSDVKRLRGDDDDEVVKGKYAA